MRNENQRKGVAPLRAMMSALREKIEVEDIDLLEGLIAEGKQPADWNTDYDSTWSRHH